MVYFRDSTSSSSTSKYFVISEHKDSKTETRLLVDTPLTGLYAASWPSLQNPFHLVDWTFEITKRKFKTWILLFHNHKVKNVASSLPCLGRRILKGEVYWSDSLTFGGEFHYIPGYWEWTEDILIRNHRALRATNIYNVVYASLFTYDHSTSIMQAFCEAWCPLTNMLLTSVGELSISLWDLCTIGGLPLIGSPYEEVIPSTRELTGAYDKDKMFLPQACQQLFDAYHQLREGNTKNHNVHVRRWIEFWSKKVVKYEQPPARKEKKSARPKSTHNPTGAISKQLVRS